ncbi:MAG: hypothetical protein R2734_02620 [Nocardioides sp.]
MAARRPRSRATGAYPRRHGRESQSHGPGGAPAPAALAASSHDLTEEQWAALTQAWGGCAYCTATRTPLQRDCVLPISRGGRYYARQRGARLPICNASKCDAEVTGWLRRRAWRTGLPAASPRVRDTLRARFAVDGPG